MPGGVKHLKLEEIKKDNKVMAALIKFCQKEHNVENILFYFDKGNMAGVHPKYVAAGSPKEVNIASKTRKILQEAFDKQDESAWNKKIDDAKEEIYSLITRDILSRFYLTEDYLLPQLEAQTTKAAKLLGIDAKHHKELVKCLVIFHTKGDSTGKKKLGEFLKKAKIDIEVKIVMQNLKKQGLV